MILRQIKAVTETALRGIPARFGTSMVVVIGVAAVVAVLVSALAIATGFRSAALRTGDRDRVIIVTADTEAASAISRAAAITVSNAPHVRTEQGAPIVSPETIVFLPLTDQNTGLNAFATLRGVGPQAVALRPEMRIVEGRMFASGASEVIVGRSAQRRLGGLEIGSTVSLPNGDWNIVGVFESAGDAHESEMMTDVETLMNAYQRNDYHSITLRLDDEQNFERLKAALGADPTLSVSVLREEEYFAAASRQISWLLTIVAYGIGGIMAFGAAFGALNTMYSAVSARALEIATLRAIGFGAVPVVISVLVEALVLALAGALIGVIAAWALLDGSTMSTLTGVTPSQLTFDLRVSADVILIGMGFAFAIATIGGLFAASRAAYVPVARAMRIA